MSIPLIATLAKAGGWLWKRLFPSKEKGPDHSQAISVAGNTSIHGSTISVQKGGDHSTVVTAKEMHLHQGVSFNEVQNIAMTVWRANFPTLKQEAMEVAEKRVQEFLQNAEPMLVRGLTTTQFERFRSPEIQYSFHQTLQAAALRPEPELQQMLAELIVGRVREEPASAQSIFYAEAIKTIPALTVDMVNLLAVHFFVTSTRLRHLRDWSNLAAAFEQAILPALTFSGSMLELQHLVYAGCGTFRGSVIAADFLHFFRRHYAPLFQNPVCAAGPEYWDMLREAQKWGLELFDSPKETEARFIFRSGAEFEKYIRSKRVDDEGRPKLRGGFEKAFQKPDVARSTLLKNAPQFELLFEKWSKESRLSSFQLTSVGRTIGETRLISLSRGLFEWDIDEYP